MPALLELAAKVGKISETTKYFVKFFSAFVGIKNKALGFRLKPYIYNKV